MKYGEELFLSFTPDRAALEAYGFQKTGDAYVWEKDFCGGNFTATVTVDAAGETSGKVTEKEFGEEFVPLNVPTYQGGFIADVRTAYTEILLDIRDKCFRKEFFVSAQANRLAKYLEETYGETVEYPFDEEPQTSGVFRYAGNRKWYALVMFIERNKVCGASKEKINALNLKIDESKRDEILQITGVYPAYHMNKQKWITAVLDDTIPDETIKTLADASRKLVTGKKK